MSHLSKFAALVAIATVSFSALSANTANASLSNRFEFAGGRCALMLTWAQNYSSPKEVKVINNSGGLVQASVRLKADYDPYRWDFIEGNGMTYQRYSPWYKDVSATPYCRVNGQFYQGPTRNI